MNFEKAVKGVKELKASLQNEGLEPLNNPNFWSELARQVEQVQQQWDFERLLVYAPIYTSVEERDQTGSARALLASNLGNKDAIQLIQFLFEELPVQGKLLVALATATEVKDLLESAPPELH